MGSPGRIPAVSPSGTLSNRPSRNPTTSTGSATPLRVRTSQLSPTLAAGPADSISRPTTRTTWPTMGVVSVRASRAKYGSSDTSGSVEDGSVIVWARLRLPLTEQSRAELTQLGVDAGVDDTRRGLDDTAAAHHLRIGEDVHATAGQRLRMGEANGVVVDRIEMNCGRRARPEPLDRRPRHRHQRRAIDLDDAPDDALGHCERELDEIALAALEHGRTKCGDFLNRRAQAREH